MANCMYDTVAWRTDNHYHRPHRFRQQVQTLVLMHRFCLNTPWFSLPIELIWEISAALWQLHRHQYDVSSISLLLASSTPLSPSLSALYYA
jgi:hypothetical protein